MCRLSGKVITIGLRLAASLALFGCNDAGVSLHPDGSADGFGLVRNVPQIGGEWLAQSKVAANSCGSLAGVPADEMLLSIEQADTAVTIDVSTPCEGNTISATGTLTPGNVLTASATGTRVVSQRCTLVTKTAVAAIANDAGSRIEGSVTIDVAAAAAPAGDCGPGFPCRYELVVTAEPCPPSGCLPATCPAAAP